VETNEFLIKLLKPIYSVLGIGYIKLGSGTICSLIPCLLIWFFGDHLSLIVRIFLAMFILVISLLSSNLEFDTKDPHYVVIDEFLGMWIALILTSSFVWILIAFFLFRFFDISKSLGISKIEKINGAVGIVFDDVLAGLYTLLIVSLLTITINYFI
jgi:phosphatidylglycerophosphatase A